MARKQGTTESFNQSMRSSNKKNSLDQQGAEVIYQIYPSSFNDSNGDGIGDLKGITQKLDYVKSLGVDSVWISPFYLCPDGRDGDGGYAINDYRKIDPKYGTMKDFKTLLNKAHEKGLRVYTDFVLAHTSNQHKWFEKSRNREAPYEDYYVWHDGQKDDDGNKLPPNNWKSVFGGRAWSWDDKREQWYLHHFLKSQPALNGNLEKIQDAALEEMKFWLDMGVDGFRFDALPFVNYDDQFRNNPWLDGQWPRNSERWEDQRFDHSICQPQTVEYVKKIRKMMNTYASKKTSLGEAISGPEGGRDSVPVAASYIDKNVGLDMCYTDALMGIYNEYPSQERMQNLIRHIENHFPEGGNCNSASNHDIPRSGSRMTAKTALEHKNIIKRQLIKLFVTLPGSFCMYQGEELGLEQASIPDDIPHDKLKDDVAFTKGLDHSRDGARTPIPWDSLKKNAGFSESDHPYLPVKEHHKALSINLQDSDPSSMLNLTRSLLFWRKQQPALLYGRTKVLDTHSPILAFLRESPEQKILCVFNMSPTHASLIVSDYVDKKTLSKLGYMKGQQLNLGAYEVHMLGARPSPSNAQTLKAPISNP